MYESPRNCNYDGYQGTLASIVYKFLIKKIGPGISVNEELAEELDKPVFQKCKRRNVYAFKDNIWQQV